MSELAPPLSWRAVFVSAAQGNVVAMRSMRDFQFEEFSKHGRADSLDLAELWGRAAADNGDSADKLKLANILHTGSLVVDQEPDARLYVAEALGIASLLADAGDESAAEMVNKLVPQSWPEVGPRAKQLSEYWSEF